jgi:hypothetical protein
MSARKARLLAAERATGAIRRGGVLTMREGETPEECAARAVAAGRTGSFLVMPPPVSAEEWEAQATANQADLMRRAEEHMRMLTERHKP